MIWKGILDTHFKIISVIMYTVLVWSLYIGLIYSYKAHSHVFPLFD